jgi:Holliday junction resolvase RusA-like endonuclease
MRMEELKILIPSKVPNWNDYIQLERSNKYIANNLKQKEKQLVKLFTKGKRYSGSYPIELVLKPHFKDFRQDLDNFRYKGLLDGLVTAGVLKNDNLKHIQRIVIEPVFDTEECVEIEIKEM